MRTFFTAAMALLLMCPVSSRGQECLESAAPSPRAYPSMTFHDSAGVVLVFGGFSRHGWTQDLRDTWAYEPSAERWQYVGEVAAIAEDGSSGITSVVYAARANLAVAFDNAGRTWTYRYETDTWRTVSPEPSPAPRCGQAMAYDAESDRVVLFGGFGCKSPQDSVFGDTWAYDVVAEQWTEMQPATSPPARMYAASAYDAGADRVVVWGGRLLEPLTDDTVWAYDANSDSWTAHAGPGGPQRPIAYATMSYRPMTRDFLLFGGALLDAPFEGSVVGDTWTYQLSKDKWTRLNPRHSPAPRSNHAMVAVPGSGDVVVFGGEVDAPYSNAFTGELWRFDARAGDWVRP